MHHRHDKWRDFAEFDSCFLSEEVHQAFSGAPNEDIVQNHLT